MELLTRRKHGLISDDEWALVLQLQTHIDDFKASPAWENIFVDPEHVQQGLCRSYVRQGMLIVTASWLY
jgi:hypothetical protein